MGQYAPVLDRSTEIQKNKIRKLPRPIQPSQRTIYENGTGIDPPNDWLDDPLVALSLPRGRYTVENAEEYLDTETVELYNGWLVRQEMSDFKDKGFEGDLYGHMSSAARQLGFGRAIPDNMECLLSDGNVIKPDLSMISWERQALRVKEYGPNKRPTLMGSPELVVEVRSPSNRRAQEKNKRKRYFDNGAEIIWDIDEKKQVIYVYRASSQEIAQVFTMNDEIDCEPLLPGWRRRVSDLFREDVSAKVMFSEVHDDGKKIGHEEGEKVGKKIGREEGEKLGREEGEKVGKEIGREEGEKLGREEGEKIGKEIGREEGEKLGREEGEKIGKEIGREEGEKLGREEGEKIGEVRTKQDTLIRLLQARFSPLPGETLNAIKQTHDITQLDNWFDQAVLAQTLDELTFS